MRVAVKQRYLPFERPSELRVVVLSQTEVTAEEDAQVDLRLPRDFPVPRRKILNRVTDDDCQTNSHYVRRLL